jgi:outer membrane protein OmpA-like peptidoglycan-associated protein/tetratricopeptide (TPR) repeat protein
MLQSIMPKFIIIPILFFIFSPFLFAQTAKKSAMLFAQGEQFFKEKKYANALTKFEEAISADRANTEAFFHAAICYLQLENAESALEYLKLIDAGKTAQLKDYDYWFALASYQFADFTTAQTYLDQYLKGGGTKKYQKEALELKRQCEIAKLAKDSLTQNFVIEPFNEQINSSSAEFGVIISKDFKRICFNRQNKEYNLKGEGKAQEGEVNTQFLISDIDKNDNWVSPAIQNAPPNTQKICQVIEENKRVLVSHQGSLKTMEWDGNAWKMGNKMENLEGFKGQTSGFMYAYDSKLIFTAESPRGDLDLFFTAMRRDKTWEVPVPLIDLNSPADENTPFLTADGKTMYFSSKGNNSMGGYDIFKSNFDSLKNRWGKPISLGLPINSIGNELHFSMFGDLGFFSSDRTGGMGASDLYRVYAFDKIRMSGKVYNRVTNQVIGNCLLKFVIDGKIIESVSEPNGSYKVDLPFHKPLEVKVYNSERIMYEENLKLTINPRRPRYLNRNYYIDDVSLPTSGSASANYLSGVVKDKKTQKVLVATVKLIDPQTNQTIKTSSTDANGRFNFFLTTKLEKYIIEGNAKGYIYGSIEISLNEGNTSQTELSLPKIEPNARFTLRNITFETNSDVLQLSSLIELDKVYDFMMDNNQIKVEISGHTDNVGNETFNMNLSERRAASVVRYLLGKGLAQNRITAKGYGATRPVASNDYEKGGRELNRRIEVMIVE